MKALVLKTAMPMLVDLIIKNYGGDVMREALDDLIDKLENKIASTPTKVDDAVILPLLTMLRETLNIPDDIGGDDD